MEAPSEAAPPRGRRPPARAGRRVRLRRRRGPRRRLRTRRPRATPSLRATTTTAQWTPFEKPFVETWRTPIGAGASAARSPVAAPRGEPLLPVAAHLARAVERGAIARHAVVYVDVRYAALDTSWDAKRLARDFGLKPKALNARGARSPGLDEVAMDPTCVYDHTPDLVKRSRLLRALLAYDEPLRRRRRRRRVPPQAAAAHHAYVLSGDAGAASCAANGAACQARLRGPARAAGLRLKASLADGGDVVYNDLGEPGDHDGAIARSVFALCAAGDVWSSGRVLGALRVGAIPVVDATYATDGGESAKGCDDPARFWRDGGGGFDRGAPFVFVKDWDNLAEALEGFGAADDALAAVASYYARDWYGDHADSPAVPGATCGTTLPTEMEGVDLGMLCFDAACAPPSVAAFECRDA
ncbi:hypothetical protein JL721_11372 [Aureococcus anophagefferens]|nr:hypothetical protein JL721_11372 [Aureococcus anophagefferens]